MSLSPSPAVEPFIFGVPLIARAAARDWATVERLFAATLQSILSQTDPRFQVVLAAHDAPAIWQELSRTDERLCFLQAPWPVEPPSAANDDGGAKKWLIKQHVLEQGGGLLMFVDGDDLVDRRSVELSRALIHRGAIGGLVSHGVAIDADSGKALALPDADAFPEPFHRLCGSTTVARLSPGQPDPYEVLGSHHSWEERAKAEGLELIPLPTSGGYIVNTGENHSETSGPFAEWRRQFSRAVATHGQTLSPALREQLGMDEAGEAPAASRSVPHA